MEKTGWYFSVLPDGWTADKVIDAKDKKAVAVMTAGSLLIAAAVAVPLYFVGRKYPFEGFGEKILLYYLLFMAALFAYIVLHELTHGAVYKLMTREKLTFGMTLTVAFCGVPHIYVKKRAALASVIMPFLVFNIVFGLPLFFVKTGLLFMLFAALIALHAAGCAGDLWVAGVLLFRYRGREVLMNDTGPKQTFYVEKT